MTSKAPFNDIRVRRAFSLAMDRRAFIKAVLQGGGIPGAALAPRPIGVWGLAERDIAHLVPGDHKAKARQILAQAGYSASNPLTLEVATRDIAIYRDVSSFVINELKQVGVEASLKVIDTVQWYSISARKEFLAGANISGYGLDDPDSNFLEHYTCKSTRNYTGYCDEQMEKMIEQQSQELDRPRPRASGSSATWPRRSSRRASPSSSPRPARRCRTTSRTTCS